MNSKEFNLEVVKDFLMDAKRALGKLEYGDTEVAYEADRIIAGCIEDLEGLVEEFEIEEEQEEEVDLPECVTIRASELQLDSDDIADDPYALSEEIGDYLSDTYEYCHFGFCVEVERNEFGEPSLFLVTDIEWDVDREEEIEEDEVRVVRTLEELEAYLIENGWRVSECAIGAASHPGWELSKGSPAGEDFSFCIEHNNEVEEAVQEIKSYAYDFDADAHVEMWIEGRRNGVAGVPSTVELVEDAQEIQKMLYVLADGVNWCEQKSIAETLSEAAERSDEQNLKFVDNRKQAILGAGEDPGFDEFDLN